MFNRKYLEVQDTYDELMIVSWFTNIPAEVATSSS